jgi:UDP-N-acetylmuramate: L-alanyl-gamma-D-glutamyl-meso-diaminopimelate ligase
LAENDCVADSFASVDDIVAHLEEISRPGDTVLIMSNGAFGNIWEKLLSALAAEREPSFEAG